MWRDGGMNKWSGRCQRWWASSFKRCRSSADNGHQSFGLCVVFRLRSHHPLGPQPCEPDGNKQLNILLCLLSSQNSMCFPDRAASMSQKGLVSSSLIKYPTQRVVIWTRRWEDWGEMQGTIIDEPTGVSQRTPPTLKHTNTHAHSL